PPKHGDALDSSRETTALRMLRTRLIAGPRAGLVLSAVLATLMTIVGAGETFFEPLRVNATKPAPISLRLPPVAMRTADADGQYHLVRVAPVLPRGTFIEDPSLAEYVALFEDARRPVRLSMLAGSWFVYLLIAIMMTTYLRRFSLSYGTLLRTQVGVLALTAAFFALAKLALLLTSVSPFALPVAALPLWVALFLDRRTAFMVGMAGSFLAASLVDFGLEYVLTYLATCFTISLALRARRRTSDILTAGAVAAVAGGTVVLASSTLSSGGLILHGNAGAKLVTELISGVVGGMLPALLAASLQGSVGRLLGSVSRGRLLDLTDLTQPLLQKMAREAQGSWEHARAMANLAEAAASSIGADALLTRVGAYYHDLGKTCQAKYFIENLDPGERSPHDGLDPDVSADAIMAHVVEGVRILREGGIPEPVVEFSYTHHGTSVIEYFWHKCLEQGNPKGLSENFFRYPGMRPRTKETAILMLVDAIEAASRTIDPPERERFEEMVNRIIFVKLRQGQMDESGLSLEDVRVMSKKLVDTLVKANHHRIRYPWQEARSRGQAPLPVPEGDASDEEVKRAVVEAMEAKVEQTLKAAER
ncbi:MAG TPA: HDIG domain-containing protein, partial [Polyangiaceae bacterium]|nr:HDIG domain-containing protein [Polyangiaceae bacterium]